MAVKLKRIKDQVVVITGASSGIGLATAFEAANRGARVVLAARHAAALKTATNTIRASGGQATWIATDVSKPAEIEGLAQHAIKTFGGFDTWVNNAGLGIFGPIQEVSDEDNRRLFDVNFWGLVHGTKTAAAYLERHGGGAIVNLGSVASDIGFPVQGMYCASKHAIKGFTDSFRMEMEGKGAPLSITLIKPAAIDTPFAFHAKNYLAREPKLPPPVYRPEDVADAIVHAAEHGGRDYYVGGGGKMASTLNKHLPSLIDWVGARTVPAMSVTSHPPTRDRAGNLHGISEDGEVHGGSPHHVQRSFYTKATTHPGLAGTLLAAAALGVTALLGARSRS